MAGFQWDEPLEVSPYELNLVIGFDYKSLCVGMFRSRVYPDGTEEKRAEVMPFESFERERNLINEVYDKIKPVYEALSKTEAAEQIRALEVALKIINEESQKLADKGKGDAE